jgi:hypothetical protein
MIGSGTLSQAKRSPAAFMLWGWTMLLVVLLSAAPTGAQPRSSFLGSAFDPSTVSVVLSPKQLRLNGAASTQYRKKPPESVGGGSLLIASLADWTARLVPEWTEPSSYHSALPIGARHLLTSVYGPRAPPLR